MGIISKFGDWLVRAFAPPVPSVTAPWVSPAEPAIRETLTAREGCVLVKEDGVLVLYPPASEEPLNPAVTDTLDFLRHALERHDWMAEWSLIMELEAEEDEEDEIAPNPILTVLDGGRAGEPREPEPGPFARDAAKDPPADE